MSTLESGVLRCVLASLYARDASASTIPPTNGLSPRLIYSLTPLTSIKISSPSSPVISIQTNQGAHEERHSMPDSRCAAPPAPSRRDQTREVQACSVSDAPQRSTQVV